MRKGRIINELNGCEIETLANGRYELKWWFEHKKYGIRLIVSTKEFIETGLIRINQNGSWDHLCWITAKLEVDRSFNPEMLPFSWLFVTLHLTSKGSNDDNYWKMGFAKHSAAHISGFFDIVINGWMGLYKLQIEDKK